MSLPPYHALPGGAESPVWRAALRLYNGLVSRSIAEAEASLPARPEGSPEAAALWDTWTQPEIDKADALAIRYHAPVQIEFDELQRAYRVTTVSGEVHVIYEEDLQ